MRQWAVLDWYLALVVAITAGVVAGCAGRNTRADPLASVIVRCFRVDVQGALSHPLPLMLELRNAPSNCTHASGHLVLRGSPEGQPRSGVHGHWLPGDDNTVRAHWGSDFFGVSLQLRKEGTNYVGIATTIRDVGHDDAPLAVRLSPSIHCP